MKILIESNRSQVPNFLFARVDCPTDLIEHHPTVLGASQSSGLLTDREEATCAMEAMAVCTT